VPEGPRGNICYTKSGILKPSIWHVGQVGWGLAIDINERLNAHQILRVNFAQLELGIGKRVLSIDTRNKFCDDFLLSGRDRSVSSSKSGTINSMSLN
jgi:hypothetical protein